MNNSVKVQRERVVIAYTDFWVTSRVMLERAEENPEGSYYLALSSLAFSAFTLEAFLNHIGENVIPVWDTIERKLGVNEKLTLVLDRIELIPNFGNRPWQVIREISNYRNKIAHGKNAKVTFNEIMTEEEAERRRFEFLTTPWQDFATVQNARRVREDLEQIFMEIHAHARIENDLLFGFGAQQGITSRLRE